MNFNLPNNVGFYSLALLISPIVAACNNDKKPKGREGRGRGAVSLMATFGAGAEARRNRISISDAVSDSGDIHCTGAQYTFTGACQPNG